MLKQSNIYPFTEDKMPFNAIIIEGHPKKKMFWVDSTPLNL